MHKRAIIPVESSDSGGSHRSQVGVIGFRWEPPASAGGSWTSVQRKRALAIFLFWGFQPRIPDDLPLEAIGKLISSISSEKWIEMYEQPRLMTKAGKAQKAKQVTPSASKPAAKRVATKRRRSSAAKLAAR